MSTFLFVPRPAPGPKVGCPAALRLQGWMSTVVHEEIPPMEIATAHVLTALYALAHRIALTDADHEFLEERGAALTPEVWNETKHMLMLADQADGPTNIDLGFEPLVYWWLGLRDERAFAERYGGLTIDEALALDCGNLAPLAASLEQRDGPDCEPLQLPLSHAWSARAERLMDRLPETGEAVLLALELALDGCPFNPEWLYPLGEAILQVSLQIGDDERVEAAQKLLGMLDRSAGPGKSDTVLATAATQLLTALWLITHEGQGHLLGAERVLEPGIEPTSDTWDAAACAAREGRIDIPVPVRLVQCWGAPEELTGEAACECLRDTALLLPQIVSEIAWVWGGEEPTDVTPGVARAVASVAVIRHMQIQRGFEPLPGGHALWFEVHQGVRRAKTVERAELLRRLRDVLLRCEIDPLAVAAAHIDRAGENHARGAHYDTRSDLADAMHWTTQYEGEDQARRDHGAVCYAKWIWFDGQAAEAIRRLRSLEGARARELLCEIEARAQAREILRQAQDEYRRDGRLASACEISIANLIACHTVRAEVGLRVLCHDFPKSSLAQHTYASVLMDLGRYRDAVAPARKSLEFGAERTGDRALLARILSRIGSDGREEAVVLAVEVLKADDVIAAVAPDLLAELADIVQYGGGDILHARRVDDLLWLNRARNDPPPEWLGAAVARRCHQLFADDAPVWLARLAGEAKVAPAVLARLRQLTMCFGDFRE